MSTSPVRWMTLHTSVRGVPQAPPAQGTASEACNASAMGNMTTRDDWIAQYAARTMAGGAAGSEAEARGSAIRAEASEAAGWVNPGVWGDPEAVVEDLAAARGG
jgi:hypothetical protein